MRLVYLGTPAMAVAPLDALVAAGHDVALVVTGEDKRRGRGRELSPSPVKAAAVTHGLPVSHSIDDIASLDEVRLGVVVAYGQIIRAPLLDALPFVNVHFSLLPRWRGAAPVERALLAGDELTGVCIMRVEEGLDTGGVYSRREVPIGERASAGELRAQLVTAGTELLVETLEVAAAQWSEGWIDRAEPQLGESTYAAKLSTADREIDWAASAKSIDRQIRVGGAWTTFRGKRLKILSGDLIEATVIPTAVQPEGKAPMSFAAWRNGAGPAADELFG
ncbi:MAG: methionyl-tRNA formyltransferase [Acidimicrobiia bacterium]|nr:methionyl-tRNA formyltransferase [Acidimicrobiia bacterium]